MFRAIWVGSSFALSAALLMTAALAPLEPAVAARRAPIRPLELGAPLHVGGLGPALAHPVRNRAPQPNFVSTCATNWRGAKCTRMALAAIRHALAAEGARRPEVVLPRNFKSLTVAEQTFVITDLERVARGLKPFVGLTRPLNMASRTAALARLDPQPVLSLLRALGISEYGSNWAGDFGPLASDYDWMYNDGYATTGINLDCFTPRSSGCWGHRDNIIGTYQHLPTLLAGAGNGLPSGRSIATVMTAGRAPAPKLTYTWRQATRHGAKARAN